MNKHPSLKVKFNNDFVQVNNSEFVEGTALIAYQGDNRNLSDITELAFTNAMPSLSLIPIVGNWLSDKQNFGGHDVAIEWQGNTLVLKDKTVPYGVVKENHNAQWIELDDNGVVHKYLQADVVLWAGRYPDQIQKVIDDGVNQSMEITVNDFSIKENGNFQINSFEYSALCLLGRDIDENGLTGSDNVEPCFEQASVVVNKYNFNEQFKNQFNNLLFEFNNQISELINNPLKGGDKEEMNNEGGSIKLDEKNELLKKHNLTSDSLNFNIEEFTIEQLEEKIEEHFALLASQKQEEIANALSVEKYRDRWGDERSKYSYVDNSETEVFAYDRQDNWNLYGFMYSMSGDKVVIDFATKKRKKFEIVDFVDGETSVVFNLFPQEAIDYAISDKEKELTEQLTSQFATEKETAVVEIQTKLDTLTTDFNKVTEEFELVKPELVRLKEFELTTLSTQRTQAEEILFSQTDAQLQDNEEYQILKQNASQFSLEQLEKEVAFIIVKSGTNVKFSSNKGNKRQNQTVKLPFGSNHNDENDNKVYGDLFEKYLPKRD